MLHRGLAQNRPPKHTPNHAHIGRHLFSCHFFNWVLTRILAHDLDATTWSAVQILHPKHAAVVDCVDLAIFDSLVSGVHAYTGAIGHDRLHGVTANERAGS